MSLDLTTIAYPIVIAGPATVNAYPIALGSIADTGPEISISWPCCLRIARKTPRTKARPTYGGTVFLPEGATLSLNTTCSSQSGASSGSVDVCLPGSLPVSAPVVADLYVNDANLALLGAGRELIDLFPDWFDKAECSKLHRVLNLFGLEVDTIRKSTSTISEGSLFNPKLNEFRVCYTSYSQLDDNSYLEFYKDSQWIHLYRCSSLEELKQSFGPCYWKSENTLIFANLERNIVTSTGSVSGSNYFHSITGTIEDKSVLAISPSSKNLPSRRWREYTPEQLSNSGIFSKEEVLTLSLPSTAASGGYTIKARTTSSSRTFVVKAQDYPNTWDTLSKMSGLVRLKEESNLSLRDRIKTVRAFKNEGIAYTSLSYARDLNLIDVFEWDGESSIDLGAQYSGYTHILIHELPQTMVFVENLRPGPSGLFISRNKEWEPGFTIYINGLIWTGDYTFSQGTLTIDTESSVSVIYSTKTWKINSGILMPTSNTVKRAYLVAVVRDVSITSLGNSWETLFLDSTRKLTGAGKVILKKLNEENPVTYGNIRWGSPNGSFKESQLLPKYIPLAFED